MDARAASDPPRRVSDPLAVRLVREALQESLLDTPEFKAVQRVLTEPAGEDGLRDLLDHRAVEQRVLRLLNGPLLARSRRCGSLAEAADAFGREVVGSTAAGVLLYRALEADTAARAPESDVWVHHLAVASLAAALADRVGCMNRELAILGGWFHDLGWFVLHRSNPAGYGEVMERIRSRYVDPLRAEEEIFGHNHVVIGRALGEEVGLPLTLIEIISGHHEAFEPSEPGPDPTLEEEVPPLVVVFLANFFAHTLGIEGGMAGPVPPIDLAAWASFGMDLATPAELLDDLEECVNEMARAFFLRPVLLANFCRFLPHGSGMLWEVAADRLRNKLAFRSDDLAAVGGVLAPLARMADPNQVMEALVSHGLVHLRFDRKILYSMAHDSRALYPLGCVGEGAVSTSLPVIPTSKMDEPVITILSQGGTWREQQSAALPGCLLHQLGAAEAAFVPIRSNDDIFGLLIVENSNTSTPLDNIDLGLLSAIGWQIGQSVENARLYKQVHDRARALGELSIRDGLTGLYNFRYFAQRLAEEVVRSGRRQEPFALMMLDLDGFQQFTERHGREAGNEALIAVAEFTRDRLRLSDLIFRYGGEEFAVIMPKTSKEQAQIPAEAIRQSVAETDLLEITENSGEELRLTVSIGISSYPDDGQTESDILTNCEQALVAAQRQGRNRVVLAQVGANDR